jgi:hypothetical protein
MLFTKPIIGINAQQLLNMLIYLYVLFVPVSIINLEIVLRRLKYKTCLEPNVLILVQ